MKTLVIATVAAAFLCTGGLAETRNEVQMDSSFDPGHCDVTGWKSARIDLGVAIPACDPVGTGLLGPVQVGFTHDEIIRDVVFDGGCGDSGTLWNFSVHLDNETATPVDEATWGVIKAGFHD